MTIKAVKFRRDGFYTQPFVFGGIAHISQNIKNPKA